MVLLKGDCSLFLDIVEEGLLLSDSETCKLSALESVALRHVSIQQDDVFLPF